MGELNHPPATNTGFDDLEDTHLLKAVHTLLCPDLVINYSLKLGTGVGLMGCAVGVEHFAHDQNIVATTDWIRHHADRAAPGQVQAQC